MAGLVLFTHLQPQWLPHYLKPLEGVDVEVVSIHRFGRSSAYRNLYKAGELARFLEGREYDFLLAACYSAGYGFWSEALKEDDWCGLDGIISIDSWYASKLGTPAFDKDIEDLTKFAEAATKKEKFLWMAYSTMYTPGHLNYAHTSEVAHEVSNRVGGPSGNFYTEGFAKGHGAMVAETGQAFLSRAVQAYIGV